MFQKSLFIGISSLTLLISISVTPAQSANLPGDKRLVADKPAPAAYGDIEDVEGEKEIKDLLRIGVLKSGDGKFEPTKPITRAQFVQWLVKSNNIQRPSERIRLADATAKAKFPDVPNTHPQFKFIQGMADAGWSVGYDDKLFKPEKVLTREEMIAIKAPLDKGGDLSDADQPSVQGWSDYKKIGKRFYGPMSWETVWKPNWVRCFGKTKSCDPQKPVTRAEAALCVWQFGISDGTVNPDKK